MLPVEISRKAEKQRQKLAGKTKPAAEKKHERTYDAFSFYTYSRIFPGGFNFVLWLFACLLGIAFLLLYVFDDDTGLWAIYAGASGIGIFLVRWLIDIFQKVFTYNSYTNFPSTLGFKLEGWQVLGAYPKQLKYREWSEKTTVEVVMKSDTPAQTMKLVKDALYLFNTNANKKFYEAEIGGDGRTSWDFVAATKICGSSDIAVIGEMYTLLHVYLRSIQGKYPMIDAVIVKFDPVIFRVEPPPSTD